MAEKPLLADAVDLDRWLTRDRELAYERRLERDRRIGIGIASDDPLQRLMQWWQQVSEPSDDVQADLLGMRIVRLKTLLSVGLLLIGLFIGVFVASAALAYDGSYPVNLLLLLGVLVGLPLLLLIATLLTLPGWLPGRRSLSETFAALSLGRWAMSWLDRIVSGSESGSLFDPARYSAFTRWQLVLFSQWFAVGFFLGVLLSMWLLVAFSDLAFGWSTTLQLRSESVHGAFSAMAVPWAGWLPQATPDLALTEASRYQRGAESFDVSRLGEWWPFVMMTVLTYGLLPRGLLLIAGAWRLRRATRQWLLNNPEITALLDRLDSPELSFAAAPEPPGTLEAPRVLAPIPLAAQDGVALLIWNEALSVAQAQEFAAQVLMVPAGSLHEFSIRDSAADQEQKLAALGTQLSGGERLIIIAKGWEPPLLEFLDFLTAVRARCPQTSIAVAPVDVSGRAILDTDREVWARTLARSHDPRLYVLAAAGVVVI